MNCKKCNFMLEQDINFCPKCGTKVDMIEVYQFCPNCGTKNIEKQYCNDCKKDLLIPISSSYNQITNKKNNKDLTQQNFNKNLTISGDNQLICYFKRNGKIFGPLTEYELEILLKHSYIDLEVLISIDNKLNWIEVTDWKKTFVDEYGDTHFVDIDVFDRDRFNWNLAEEFAKGLSKKFYRELKNIVYFELKKGKDFEVLISRFIGINCGFVLTNYNLIIIDDIIFAKTKILDLTKIERISLNILEGKYLEIDYKESESISLYEYKVYKKYHQYILDNIEIVKLLIDISKIIKSKNVKGRLINELYRLDKLEKNEKIDPLFSGKIRIKALNLKSNAIKE